LKQKGQILVDGIQWKDCKAVASVCQPGRKDLKAIYGATTIEEAEMGLDEFPRHWDERYPAISSSWRADWDRLTVFFDYPPEIRRVIYTTNTIESLNYMLLKVLKTRGRFQMTI